MNIITALYPVRISDDCRVYMKVWFEELDGPVIFVADPFDPERHGKELWIRAMAGEYGPVRLFDAESSEAKELLKPYQNQTSSDVMKVIEL